jgi:hypothetical protein
MYYKNFFEKYKKHFSVKSILIIGFDKNGKRVLKY